VESFNGKLRDELLGRELFYTLQKVDEFFGETHGTDDSNANL
jgi:hypothetical protein